MRKMKSSYWESKLQVSLVSWFDQQYAHLRNLLHSNNNNSQDAWRGKRNKDLGVRAGAPDLEFTYGESTYFIEVKLEQKKLGDQIIHERSHLSKSQKEMHRDLRNQGTVVFVVRSLDEFMTVIDAVIRGDAREIEADYSK